jgi:hypothetical protein
MKNSEKCSLKQKKNMHENKIKIILPIKEATNSKEC